MIPAGFDYHAPRSVADAIRLLGELGPDARLLAGGHSLLPMMKLRLASPLHVIDIDPLAHDLGYVQPREDHVRIGAMTRHRALLESELLQNRLAIFTDAERVIADPAAYLDVVEASTREAQSIGINAIPAFVLDSRLIVLGAQPLEVFREAFAQLAA